MLLYEESRLLHGILVIVVYQIITWRVLRWSFPLSRRMPYNSHKPTTIYTTGDWCALNISVKDGNPKRPPTDQRHNMGWDRESHSKFRARCINKSVIFIEWASFGKHGQTVLLHPNPHVVASLSPQKMNGVASMGNLRLCFLQFGADQFDVCPLYQGYFTGTCTGVSLLAKQLCKVCVQGLNTTVYIYKGVQSFVVAPRSIMAWYWKCQ